MDALEVTGKRITMDRFMVSYPIPEFVDWPYRPIHILAVVAFGKAGESVPEVWNPERIRISFCKQESPKSETEFSDHASRGRFLMLFGKPLRHLLYILPGPFVEYLPRVREPLARVVAMPDRQLPVAGVP